MSSAKERAKPLGALTPAAKRYECVLVLLYLHKVHVENSKVLWHRCITLAMSTPNTFIIVVCLRCVRFSKA